MAVTRRTLLDGSLLQLQHVVARPPGTGSKDLECQDSDLLVLPLAGVFTKHDGPRAQVTGTPTDAVFVQAARPYRLSFPDGIGDESLTLRYPAGALPPPRGSHALLPPAVLLAKGLLWRKLRAGGREPLEAEELALEILQAMLGAGSACGAQDAAQARLRPRIARVKEAIWLAPGRNWTLEELAALAHVSPWHLARVFRAHIGEPVHRYMLRARLARTIDAVLDAGSDLTAIALDAGFSSHSHFTARFRALFGMTPSDLRRTGKGGTAMQLRKIVTAQAPAGV